MTDSEGRTVRYTAEEIDAMIARGESKTDWERVDTLTEEEIESSVDFDEEGEIDWDSVNNTLQPSRAAPVIHVDPDVLAFFRGQGPGYQTRMNEVLRSYVEAQREKTEPNHRGRKAS